MNYLKSAIQALVLVAFLQIPTQTKAHCEVPCGIYNDSARIQMLYEHITTIERSMAMIKKIETAENLDYNQLVRWVNTKEQHAEKIQDIVYQYFMTQRLKPIGKENKKAYNKYIEQITLSHKILIYAMKAKQSIDEEYIKKLRETVHLFEHAYFGHTH